MPDYLEDTTPTWDLICTMLRPGHSKHVRATLNARMEAVGVQDLFELVALEMAFKDRGQPYRDIWDPEIVGSGVTLPQPPLYLMWDALVQEWEAATNTPEGLHVFGYYPTIAAADAGFRNLVGLTNDTRLIQVHVNGEDHCRIIVAGEFVPPL